MYRPIISNSDIEDLNKRFDTKIINRKYKGEDWPVIQFEGKTIDSSFSFVAKDKRWTDRAKKMNGEILILGLGFGKSVLSACANQTVKSVTVVELHEGVIDVFWLCHGKDFTGREKLTIINEDALEYKPKKKFKHVFIDIFYSVYKVGYYRQLTRELREKYKDSVIHQIPLL